MPTPDSWLNIPLADYEGHMNAPEVGQLRALSDLFAEALASCCPESLAILGIAGGNGLEHVDPRVTRRVVGIDINPNYLDTLRQRHGARLTLELHCCDLAQQALTLEPVQLVHAALIFEHAGTGCCLENAVGLVAPGGSLSVILQLPAESEPNVAATPYASIQTLAGQFSLIDPEQFCSALARSGLHLNHPTSRALPAGKAFWMGVFSRT
jgi:Methyltransferase domain